MTEEGGVHGIQCGKKRAPGVVTFCVVGDDMFGQGRFVQIGCIAQGAFLTSLNAHAHARVQCALPNRVKFWRKVEVRGGNVPVFK